MRKFSSSVLGLLSLLPLSAACGRVVDGAAPAQQTSQTASLVGLPCEDFGGDYWAENKHCVSFQAGISREMLFDIQGFDAAQTQKIKDSLDVAVARYNAYWAGGQQAFISCVTSASTKDYVPKGNIGVTMKGNDKLVTWAMTSIQFSYAFHSDLHRPATITAFDQPSPDGQSFTMGQAYVGDDSIKQAATTSFDNGNMNIEVNRVALNNTNFSSDDFAGTIVHEWLHREGWDHPTGYPGSMIKELGLCISRNSAPRPFGLDDVGYHMAD